MNFELRRFPSGVTDRLHASPAGITFRTALRPFTLVLVETPMQDIGVAGVAAMTVLLTASALAAGVIWVMTTQPESFVMLATAGSIWDFLVGLAGRLLAII